jgi:hypothetical protein
MRTVDLKKDLKHLYKASAKQVVEVHVPAMTYLMLDGVGDPNTSSAYAAAVEALFSEEGPTVERVHQYICERGQRRGKHHEIYLSDVRRADPSRWRTIIRQPMQGSAAPIPS